MNDLMSRNEVIDMVEELRWYRIEDGELKRGAHNENEALLKYTDVIETVEKLQSALEVVYCMNCCGSEQRGNAIYCKTWNRYTPHRGFCYFGKRKKCNNHE